MTRITRRRFAFGVSSWLLAHAIPGIAGLRRPTPSQSAGPFYPPELPLDDDNDLAQVSGQGHPARGRITDLTGRILDPNGHPLRGLRIEIWQCDAHGRYRHPRDTGERPIDPGFQGHGQTLTDIQGRYRFRTIHPVPYPGRTPHIHVAVFPQGEQPFITQLYVAGEPRNAYDFLYQRVPEALRPLVTTEFRPPSSADKAVAAEWDIVLGMTPA